MPANDERIVLCIEACGDRAWRLAYAQCRNTADADDIAQRAFIAAARKIDTLPSDPWPWIAAAVVNEARTVMRSKARRERRIGASDEAMRGIPDARGIDPAEYTQRMELVRRLFEEVDRLDEAQREAIHLTTIAGLSLREAAKTVGVDHKTLGKRVRDGIAHLQARLGADDEAVGASFAFMASMPRSGGYADVFARWHGAVQTSAASGAGSAGTLASAGGILGAAMGKYMLGASVLVLVMLGGASFVFGWFGLGSSEEPSDASTSAARGAVSDGNKPSARYAHDDPHASGTREIRPATGTSPPVIVPPQGAPDNGRDDGPKPDTHGTFDNGTSSSSHAPSSVDPNDPLRGVPHVAPESGRALGSSLPIFHNGTACTAIAFAPGRDALITADVTGAIKEWNLDTGRVDRYLLEPAEGTSKDYSNAILGLAFSRDGQHIVCTSCAGSVIVLAYPSCSPVAEITFDWGAGGNIVAFTPDSSAIAIAMRSDRRSRIELWDWRKAVRIGILEVPTRSSELPKQKPTEAALPNPVLMDFAFTEDGRYCVAGVADADEGAIPDNRAFMDTSVVVWDMESGKVLRSFSSLHAAYGVAMLQDGRHFVAMGTAQSLKSNGTLEHRCEEQDIFNDATLSATVVPMNITAPTCCRLKAIPGSDVIFLSNIKQCGLWNVSEHAMAQAPTLDARGFGEVAMLAVSSDGFYAGIARYSGELRVWDLRTGALVMGDELNDANKVPAHTDTVRSLQFTGDSRLVSSGDDGKIIVWDLASGNAIASLDDPDPEFGVKGADIASSSDGFTLASCRQNFDIRLWDMRSFVVTDTLSGGESRSGVWPKLAFSPDGRHLLRANMSDQVIDQWDVITRQLTQSMTIPGPECAARSLSYAGDGRSIIVAGYSVVIMDAQSGAVIRILADNERKLFQSAILNRDGSHALVSTGNGAEVWKVATGEREFQLNYTQATSAVALHPAGTLVALGGVEGISLWDLNTGSRLQEFSEQGGTFSALCFSSDGKWLAAANYDKSIRIWQIVD